jgi:hypothetical protein
MLSPKDNISIKDNTLYNYICTSNASTSGGTSIAISNCVPQKELKLNTILQAIAVQVTNNLFSIPSSKYNGNKLT